jgi:hypothetical protein
MARPFEDTEFILGGELVSSHEQIAFQPYDVDRHEVPFSSGGHVNRNSFDVLPQERNVPKLDWLPAIISSSESVHHEPPAIPDISQQSDNHFDYMLQAYAIETLEALPAFVHAPLVPGYEIEHRILSPSTLWPANNSPQSYQGIPR